MWGASAGQHVVDVLWFNLLLQKICTDLEHCFPTILASSPSSFLCAIHHAVVLLSSHLMRLHCLSALAVIASSSIPTGFGITNTEVTVLCPKILIGWGGTFTGVKNTGFDLTSGEHEILNTAPDRIHVATFLMEEHAQMKNFRHLEFKFPRKFKLQLGAVRFQPGCFYFTLRTQWAQKPCICCGFENKCT